MLRILTDEGFNIKSRELNRVRSANRWLLRSPSTAAGSRGKRKQAGQNLEGSISEGDEHDEDEEENEDDYDADEGILADDNMSPAAVQLMLERRLKMETESADRFASRKRRRRTRQYAGMPADPPGPPRFPSETTLAQSQEILGLDKAAYTEVREKFHAICESARIIKKTIAGPEAWDTAKNELVGALPHLQNVMWIDKSNLERKKLALDVICSDVTKRMRAGGEKGLVLAEAKNILGLNPAESRDVRATFYDILKADGFTSKVALGPDRWKMLKQKWIDESEMLRRVLRRLDDSDSYEMKAKAVEALATDVMKRLRDDQSKRRPEKQEKGKSVVDSMDHAQYGESAAGLGQLEDSSSGFAASILVPEQHPQAHSHPSRMLPDHLVDPQMSMQMSMEAQLGGSLLLDPNAQSTFMSSHQQFMPAPAAMPAAASPFHTSQAAAFQMPATNTNVVPVYLRELAPGSMNPVGETWIAFLTSPTPSLEELHQVAAQKTPGSICVEVVGLVKVPDGMGTQYLPLQIHDDDQLGAHLAQDGPPMFHVRLSF